MIELDFGLDKILAKEEGNKCRLMLGDCVEEMDKLIEAGVQVDLTVTSPPYDNLRSYKGAADSWNFEKFKQIADRLYKLTKKGGIVAWVVGDATINGNKTLTSFKQALYFQEIGFLFNDNIIFEKNSSAFPQSRKTKRYTNIYEYVFILTKGKIRDDIELLCDKPNKYAHQGSWGVSSQYNKDDSMSERAMKTIPEFSKRNNIWKYAVGCEKDQDCKHPAKMAEKLCIDLVKSYSVEGDVVFDPFLGSGTTAKAALLNKRDVIGIEINDSYMETSKKRLKKYFKDISFD